MREVIQNQLNRIEALENVKILLAVESGSRAWGFASPDSDYDVRFIYVRPQKDYLRLERNRDVIELPIEDDLDINGWDLDKALRLLRNSNPTLFEWFSSPIVYRESAFAAELRGVMPKYFSTRRGLSHYLSMAIRNYRDHLQSETVKAKKYFYALRPVLACRWILDNGTPPPMLFSELMEAELDPALLPEVNRLLDLKQNAPEVKTIPTVESINRYLEHSIEEVQTRITQLPKEPYRGWEELDQLFLSQLE
ncbi:MAG: nucleotidyltransferase domain-containing protein [Oscillospiraceae bacterium]|nr:nucleotidyltransferase domain-containing protein [Oscillospiraceae bacterium]MBR6839422.1 nucleotidyltransferase domain-containing protein [Oscillospiraceae bacterium]